MNAPTYEQQWQKITEAYMRDEIRPYSAKFCFCGTLCDNDLAWNNDSFLKIHNDYKGYTGKNYVAMEQALFKEIFDFTPSMPDQYEAALFKGMCAALEVLRQIHEAKGDVTAKPTILQKRVLCEAN